MYYNLYYESNDLALLKARRKFKTKFKIGIMVITALFLLLSFIFSATLESCRGAVCVFGKEARDNCIKFRFTTIILG
jgi:hypothetical protein